MAWDWRVPDIHEVQRAQDFIGWAYQGGYDTAEKLYRDKYGSQPCWVMNEPDGGLLAAVNALWRCLNNQEMLRRRLRSDQPE